MGEPQLILCCGKFANGEGLHNVNCTYYAPSPDAGWQRDVERLAALLERHVVADERPNAIDGWDIECKCRAVVHVPSTMTLTEAWRRHEAHALRAAGVHLSPTGRDAGEGADPAEPDVVAALREDVLWARLAERGHHPVEVDGRTLCRHRWRNRQEKVVWCDVAEFAAALVTGLPALASQPSGTAPEPEP